ncbi:MAG: sigma-70 family RNA polymerase sigma factor [Chitinivibrionales bacterium]|nr:sigma-70 family RNA polymerase sigma factor [Chitinivibrionales bacterium]
MQKSEALYFRDLSRYRVLTDEEEQELVQRVKKNDKEAINQLITANLRFVVSIARRYRGRGLSYLELINEGNVGMLKAAKRYKTDMNVKFISYAVWWIRQSIQKAFFEQASTIRVPANKIALINKFKRALDRNGNDFDKTIEMEEFVDNKHEIVDVMNRLKGISLDAPVGGKADEESSKTLQDVIGEAPNQESDSERRELQKVLDSVLQEVSSREERILRMYYGLNFSRQFTLEEIGNELNLSRERVRLIRDRSLLKLFKNPNSREKLYPFIAHAEE